PKVGLVFPGMLLRIIFQAVPMSVGIFLLFYWAEAKVSLDEARTIAFCSMAIFAWFKAMNARSDEHTVFSLGIFRNRWLVAVIFIAVMLQLAVVYIPSLQVAFHTVPLGINEWASIIAAGAALFVIEETRKALLPQLFSLGKWKPVQKAPNEL
ncbi:MAG: cation transporting ATPase C-terminal domain-containing protein, partial [Dehalococcoidales bacterium]|nr:cation transporting ATPase C-terminal domain-containing protein [Dehalococcoidales bacterium]